MSKLINEARAIAKLAPKEVDQTARFLAGQVAFELNERDCRMDAGAVLEELKFLVGVRPAFKAWYDQYRERDGEPFTILSIIDEPDEDHDEEVLPMVWIQFEDEEIIEAWPEEVIDYD